MQIPGHIASRAASSDGQRSFLVLSAHDYRSKRRANIHFIAEELSRRGQVNFFSLRYSNLSRLRPDPRHDLEPRANRIETLDGVGCYLWKTPLHPFNTRLEWARPLETFCFRRYQTRPAPVLDDWIRSADTVVFESGLAIIYFDRVKALNPRARTIYIASDDLDTINSAAFTKACLASAAARLDCIRVPSPHLAQTFADRRNVFLVPHGIDKTVRADTRPSPYGPGLHAVSVGSMLFDPQFVLSAAHQFPHITFHVIGCGHSFRDPPANVRIYGEMPHADTIPYLRHASFGMAPYRGSDIPAYLADTSMKLIQYELLRLPVVCPHAVVGDYANRFGYTPGADAEIRMAVERALNAPRPLKTSRPIFSWGEVVDRVLSPTSYADTRLTG
jgi:2-beta-glucuronyltransferase